MTSRQKLIILLAVVLAVLFYFAPKIASEKKQEAKEEADFTSQFDRSKEMFPAEQKTIYDKLEQGLKKAQADNNEQSWIASATDFLKGARLAKR